MGRNSHFNAAESKKLLKILEKYKDILDSKKTDVQTVKSKEEAWEEIASKFNAKNEIFRNVKELKTKYKNIRYTIKHKMTAEPPCNYGNVINQSANAFNTDDDFYRNVVQPKEESEQEFMYENEMPKIVNVRSKWMEDKLQAELEMTMRANQLNEERHVLEMQILSTRLEKEKVELEIAKRKLSRLQQDFKME